MEGRWQVALYGYQNINFGFENIVGWLYTVVQLEKNFAAGSIICS